jgi:hypothetical protein
MSMDGLSRAVNVIERAALSTDHLVPYRKNDQISWIIRYNVGVYAMGLCIFIVIVELIVFIVKHLSKFDMRLIGFRSVKVKQL